MITFTQERDELIQIIDELFNQYQFAVALTLKCNSDANTSDAFHDWYNNYYNTLIKVGLNCMTGATKICIIPEKLNWIIKVDYPLTEQDTYSYCAREYANYICACDNHVENYFATTCDLGEHYGYHFYAQEKCKNVVDGVDSILFDVVANSFSYDYLNIDCDNYSEDELEDMRYDYICDEVDNLDTEERLYYIFDNDDDIDSLLEFIHTRMIDDLHSGNFGSTEHGIVIFDFSGFTKV